MPVDPFGQYPHSPDEGIWYGDYGYDSGGNWYDLISQGIDRAQQAYIYGELGYPPVPPGSTNIYAPQTSYPAPVPMPMPAPYPGPGAPPTITPQPAGGLQLSNTTLMLLGGAVLLFVLGSKRGR